MTQLHVLIAAVSGLLAVLTWALRSIAERRQLATELADALGQLDAATSRAADAERRAGDAARRATEAEGIARGFEVEIVGHREESRKMRAEAAESYERERAANVRIAELLRARGAA